MTKIVINKCYGGFGLSPKATVEYLNRKGKQAHFYDENYTTNTWHKITDISKVTSMFYHILTVDLGTTFKRGEYPNGAYFIDSDIPRADPDLIAVVEELGEKSWGVYSKLYIVEIPDDVDWEIADYDGMESINEKHRSWS